MECILYVKQYSKHMGKETNRTKNKRIWGKYNKDSEFNHIYVCRMGGRVELGLLNVSLSHYPSRGSNEEPQALNYSLSHRFWPSENHTWAGGALKDGVGDDWPERSGPCL